MSDKHREIAFYTFDSEDEALRAIQGLKAAGFDDETIKVAATTRKLAEQVAERGGVAAAEEWTVSDPEPDGDGQFKVIVEAGENAAFARRVMVDGLVDATGLEGAAEEAIYLDSSTGSGAGVAASTGTATGVTPGAGYEGNTGSSVGSSTGALGQFAPGADTSDDDDDFPGRRDG